MPGILNPVAPALSAKLVLEEYQINRERVARYLKRKVKDLRDKHIEASSEIITGDVTLSIMKIIKRETIDTIIMMSNAECGLKRVILGSITDKVIRQSGKLVLAFKLDNHDHIRSN
jgi:nucleotide-binding universal stress UspA family protein